MFQNVINKEKEDAMVKEETEKNKKERKEKK